MSNKLSRDQIENKRLAQENEILRRQLNSSKKPKTVHKLYSDKPYKEFNEYTKTLFIDSNRDILLEVFEFSDPAKKRHNKPEWLAINAIARENFEDWTEQFTGYRWMVNGLNVEESVYTEGVKRIHQKPEDFIDISFTHKGYLRHMLNDDGESIIDKGMPGAVDLTMTVRIYRYELG